MVKTIDYGTISHEGKAYQLIESAQLTDRVFPQWWGDVNSGDEYISEWSCRAQDDDGNSYRVYWQFDASKGQEPEDDGDWPWDDQHITKVVEL